MAKNLILATSFGFKLNSNLNLTRLSYIFLFTFLKFMFLKTRAVGQAAGRLLAKPPCSMLVYLLLWQTV